MADDKNVHIKIPTDVDQKGLDEGLKEVNKKVKHSSEEGGNAFKEMFEALSLEAVVEKGFDVVKDFFQESIKGAKEAEVNAVQLKNSLENVGAAGNFDSIIESSEALSKQFVISKQDIIQSQTALETYGKLTQKQIKDLEPVILNYSKKTGKSVAESTDDIIRGLEGQGRGLKKIGVELKTGGTTAQNYAQIMDQVGDKVNGAADAFNKTSAGGMAKFHLSIEELQESVGAKLLPAIADLTSSFVPLIEQISPLVDELMPILTQSLKTLAPLFTTVGEVVIKVLKPLGEVFGIIIDSFNDILPLLTPIIELFGDMVSNLLEGLVPSFKELVKAITPIIKEILPILSSLMEDLSPIIGVVIKSLSTTIHVVALLLEGLNKIIKPILAVTNSFIQFVGKALKPVIDEVKKVYDWLTKLFDKVADFLGLGDASNKDDVKKVFEAQGEAAKEAGETIEKADNKVDKNKEKLAKKQQAAAKKAKKDLKTQLNDELKDIQAHNDLLVEQAKDGSYEKIKAEKNSADQTIAFYEKIGANGKETYKNLGLTEDEWALKKLKLQKTIAAEDKKYSDDLAKELEDWVTADEAADQAAKDRKDAAHQAIIDQKKKEVEELEADEADLDDNEWQAKKDLMDKISAAKDIALQAEMDAELDNTKLTETQKAKIVKKYDKLRTRDHKAESDARQAEDKKEADNALQLGTTLNSALSNLSDAFFAVKTSNLTKGSAAEEKAAKQQFETNKKMQISAAIISGIQGVINALTAQSVIPEPFGEILKIATAVSVAASTAASIAKIKNTQFSSTSATSAPTSTSSASPSIPSSMTAGQTMGLGSTPVTPTLQNQGLQYQKVIVSDKDIKKVGNQNNLLANRAVVGK